MTEWMSDESGTVMVPGYEWARLHDEMMSLQVENERLEERNAALEIVLFNCVPKQGLAPEAFAAVATTMLRLREEVER